MGDKTKLNIKAGGIFSKTMLGIQRIDERKFNVEDCYFNVIDERALNEYNFNPFDYVLEQKVNQQYTAFNCGVLPSYNSKGYMGYSKVEQSPEFLNLKRIASELKYKEELLERVNAIELPLNTVGVHLRMCDMNTVHAEEYGLLTFEDYVEAIEKEITSENKIFVASDNEESIKKLQIIFKDRILFVDGMIRCALETDDSFQLQLDYFKNKEFWVEAFLDMLLLSRCSKLICRTSNLANMAIISSNTIQKIIML